MPRRRRSGPLLALLALACAVSACSTSSAASTAASTATPATITISHDEVLTADLDCTNLTIDTGVTLVTNGFNIYCQGVVDNQGTIDTGATPVADFPLSYGGSGSGATGPGALSRDTGAGYATRSAGGILCAYPDCPGGRGSSPRLPRLTAKLLEAWRAAGMTLYLAGAAGGSTPVSKGGAGAYGLYIAAGRIIAGTIDAAGANGAVGHGSDYSGGGGGGTVILDYGAGGYKAGKYLLSGGHVGTTPKRWFDIGGSGHVAAVALVGAPAENVSVVASSPSFSTATSAQSSVITATFTDQHGAPVAGVPVTWFATSGNLSTASGVTNALGRASVTLVQGAGVSPSSPRNPDLTAAVIARDADNPQVNAIAYVKALSRTVSLIPYPSPGKSWSWTAACPYNPAPCHPARANPDVGWLQLNGQLWNLGIGAAGATQLTIGPTGGLSSTTSLATAPAGSVDTWTRGDPGPTYGIVLGYPAGSPPESPSLKLPMQIGNIPPDLVATASYDVIPSATTSYEFGYDLWLEPRRTMTSVGEGTIEVMVSTDNSGPESLPAGGADEISMPYSVDDQVNQGYDAWDVYVGGIEPNGQTVAGGGNVTLVLDAPVGSGKVSIDMSDVLSAVGDLLDNQYQWSGSLDSYWLDTIQLGSEVGPGGTSLESSGPANLSWTLSDYCFGVRAHLASTGC